MVEILDADGNEITYWPIPGLVVGQLSEDLVAHIQLPVNGKLFASVGNPERVSVRCTMPTSNITTGARQGNISTTPADLNYNPVLGQTMFRFQVRAKTPTPGQTFPPVERVPISVTITQSSPAGWKQ